MRLLTCCLFIVNMYKISHVIFYYIMKNTIISLVILMNSFALKWRFSAFGPTRALGRQITTWRSKRPRRNPIWEIYVDREIIRLLKDAEHEVSKGELSYTESTAASVFSSLFLSFLARCRKEGPRERREDSCRYSVYPFIPFENAFRRE